MSIANLLAENQYGPFFIGQLYSHRIDGGATGAVGVTGATGQELDIGLGRATSSVHIGTTGTPVYINQVLFNGVGGSTGNFTAGAPVAASDGNAIIINNGTGVIQMEIADATHPGIVTAVSQTFAGVKTLLNGALLSPSTTYSSPVALASYYRYSLTVGFGGGINVINATVILERIGNTIIITIPQVYNGSQNNGTITSNALPIEFQVSTDRWIEPVTIFDSHMTGGIGFGSVVYHSTGILEFGLGTTALSSSPFTRSISPFSSGGSTGYGNGICAAQLVFCV